ncbi:MAG: hypothetical protein ACUVRL_07730 [Candidatus Saccharicenans sp.]|uniref:hypothetical protein n=1 Tax=Candidatus Saccharicenans sp. TaxID=2819258 RepID=UPI00404AAD7A
MRVGIDLLAKGLDDGYHPGEEFWAGWCLEVLEKALNGGPGELPQERVVALEPEGNSRIQTKLLPVNR